MAAFIETRFWINQKADTSVFRIDGNFYRFFSALLYARMEVHHVVHRLQLIVLKVTVWRKTMHIHVALFHLHSELCFEMLHKFFLKKSRHSV